MRFVLKSIETKEEREEKKTQATNHQQNLRWLHELASLNLIGKRMRNIYIRKNIFILQCTNKHHRTEEKIHLKKKIK